jgi:ER-bound oxygenase mpaB/B'/Rubber oxygenase, catalytic domain
MAGGNGNSKWTNALLDPMRELGDPVADGPVAAVLERGGVDEVNALMQTLVRVDQPVPEQLPPELRAYLAQSLPLPEWADTAKIERAQELFKEWGVLITLCLFCASLPASYAAANGVKVLYTTARLDTDARRRVMETGQFLMDVLDVGGLGEEGKGRRVIQRVRLMHAAVRHLIKARNDQAPGFWHPEWGKPINQEDLAGSLLTFSYVVAQPLPRLGARLSAEDVDAYIHLWNVIGHLLGLRDELLVRDVSDATALVDTIRRRQFGASPEGQELTRALLELLDELTPLHRFDDTIPPLIRHLIGDDTADLLLVPETHLGPLTRAADWGLEHFFGEIERDLAHDQVMSDMARPLGGALMHTIFALERGGERAPFAIPEHLARRWDLPA